MLTRGCLFVSCSAMYVIFWLVSGVAPAQSQTACRPAFVGNSNFCNVTVGGLLVPPSPPAKVLIPADAANPGYPLNFVFIFVCSDFFDGHLIDCGYSVEILKAIDSSPNEANADNGGHIASKHGSPHPLIEPKDSGIFDFAGSPESSGIVVTLPPDPPKMIGNTGKSVAVVLYPVPQASGDLFIERLVVMPPRYLCSFPGCFDQVPGRFGLNRMQFLHTLHVGIPIEGPFCPFCPVIPGQFRELIQTPEAPFMLIQGDAQLPAHPGNHFGTTTALTRITQIAQAYRENNPDLGKLKINDLSLVRGGVYDLNKQWFGENTKGNGHWSHRTGTEADIDTTDSNNNDTSCKTDTGGNDLVKAAIEALIPERFTPTIPQGAIAIVGQPFGPRGAHRCESRTDPGGRNHVYLE